MSPRHAGLMVCALCLSAIGLATPSVHAQSTEPVASTPPATSAAPATAAPPAAAEPPAAPAATPATPAATPVATQPPPQRAKWTAEDVARVRAMLRAAQPQAQPPAVVRRAPAPKPRVYGDAGGAVVVGASVDSLFRTEPGYDLFGENDVATRLGLFAGHDLVSLLPQLILAAEVGFGIESEEQNGLLGGTLSTDLSMTSLYGAASLRYVLHPVLQPHARVAAGASLLDVEFSPSNEVSDEDDAVSPFVSLGAGLLLRTPTRAFETHDGRFASVSFGVLIEAGYTFAASADLSLGDTSGEHEIPKTQADLGTLELSGPYVRTSLVGRF
jgi:hypothetical protein